MPYWVAASRPESRSPTPAAQVLVGLSRSPGPNLQFTHIRHPACAASPPEAPVGEPAESKSLAEGRWIPGSSAAKTAIGLD